MNFEFMLYGRVDDVQRLYTNALIAAMKDGIEREDAEHDLRPDGEIDVSACIRMILDPGIVAGLNITDSECELNGGDNNAQDES